MLENPKEEEFLRTGIGRAFRPQESFPGRGENTEDKNLGGGEKTGLLWFKGPRD